MDTRDRPAGPGRTTPAGRPPLRKHQRQALEVLGEQWPRRRRTWVVLPPGAGKTRVGVETAAGHLADGTVSHAVVLTPNTAIQGQWLHAAAEAGLRTGDSRDLAAPVTVLTYQSVAVFAAEDEAEEVDEDRGGEAETLLDRLHPNGRRLVEALATTEGLLLVLDECHHLLEVWGRLVGELLDSLPAEAHVLGLTATPPETLTRDQARLVEELFGPVAYRTSVPAVVREGDLAPYAELAWLTTPTEHEQQWLAEEATRVAELTTRLTDPGFGSLPFLEWLTRRFVDPVPQVRTWASLVRDEPELTRAALRAHHAGLLALPEGARPVEAHRRDPSAEDWVLLIDDWMTGHVARSDDPRDDHVVEVVRRLLPAIGHVWTRRGIRRGRSGVDRVLARSAAKTTAAVEIVSRELSTLGERLRALVLCDHEAASATLPVGLVGVLDARAGSARAALLALCEDPATAGLSPLLVTGSTVAGAATTLERLRDRVAGRDRGLAGDLVVVEADDGVAELVGPWSSRRWVREVTGLFEDGDCQVLVGTRGLLGEGWDARRISTLVDLTVATTPTAVVQTRGRALRTDPTWPDKVAVNWSVTCVDDTHPQGGNDWDRLVRKHTGFHSVDADGDVVDGVAHLDAEFSPYSPPPASAFDAANARAAQRAEDRETIRHQWRVGAPYADEAVAVLRVRPTAAGRIAGPPVSDTRPVTIEPPRLLPAEDRVVIRPDARADLLAGAPEPPRLWLVPATAGTAGAALSAAAGWLEAAAGLGAVAAGSGLGWRRQRRADVDAWARRLAREAGAPPTVERVAAAVADALHAAGLTRAGSGGVVVEVHPGGEYRCRLDGVPETEAQVFATALDELLAPMATPRYVVSRPVLTDIPSEALGRPLRPATALERIGSLRPGGVVWHPVPTVLAVNTRRAGRFLAAWRTWVAGGRLLFTGSAEGAGVLAAQQGTDPFAVTTVIRTHWT